MSSTIVVDAGGESVKIQNDEGKKGRKNPLTILENIEQQQRESHTQFLSYIDEKCVEL
jgi:hypothetical protein